jgi:hypothetical protein
LSHRQDDCCDNSGCYRKESKHTIKNVPTNTLLFQTFLFFFTQNHRDSRSIDNFMVSATPVPEPEAYAMLLAGLAIVGFVGRGRKK